MVQPVRVVGDADAPERAVLCFFGDVVSEVVAKRPDARLVTTLTSEAGPSPVWEITVSGTRVAVLQPGVGAPMAAAYLEESIALGCRRVVACGAAGGW